MTTMRQTGNMHASGSQSASLTPTMYQRCESIGHIRISAGASPESSGSSCWRCGVGLSSDYRVRVVTSVQAALLADAADYCRLTRHVVLLDPEARRVTPRGARCQACGVGLADVANVLITTAPHKVSVNWRDADHRDDDREVA